MTFYKEMDLFLSYWKGVEFGKSASFCHGEGEVALFFLVCKQHLMIIIQCTCKASDECSSLFRIKKKKKKNPFFFKFGKLPIPKSQDSKLK